LLNRYIEYIKEASLYFCAQNKNVPSTFNFNRVSCIFHFVSRTHHSFGTAIEAKNDYIFFIIMYLHNNAVEESLAIILTKLQAKQHTIIAHESKV
jgi:hypothetical protein